MKAEQILSLRITPNCIKYHAGRSNVLEVVLEQVSECYFKQLDEAEKNGESIDIQFIINKITNEK